MSESVLILRTVGADMESYQGFVWPVSGPVEAPAKWWGTGRKPADVTLGWNPEPECGGGLHGLLWGEGSGQHLDWSDGARWLVIRAAAADVVVIDDEKCKFRCGEVVHCGDRKSATDYIAANGGAGRCIVGGTATAGYGGTATAGDRGTATAGYGGTATAGYGGTATAGDRGTATAGDRGTATAGDGGTATAGYGGTLLLRYWDNRAGRDRLSVGYVGEDGIKAGETYRLDDKGAFVLIPKPAEATA